MKELLGADVIASVPAQADFLHVLRSVTVSVAGRMEFPLDALDDLRLAIDEACAQLMSVGSQESTITLRITPTEEGLELVAAIDAPGDEWPPSKAEESLAWRLMSGLTDETRYETVDHHPALRLTKRLPAIDRDRE